MSTSNASPGPPAAWQQAVGQRLAEALARSRSAHAPAHDRPAGAADQPWVSRWQVAPRSSTRSMAELARRQARDPAGRARAQSLFERCLRHYREQLRPLDRQDDAGVALACLLAACIQAQSLQAVTLPRWRAVHDWLEAWVADDLDWDGAPIEQRQDFFERMACLAVAIGEWTVQASRQGEPAIRTAQALARGSLKAELGLSIEQLADGLSGVMAPAGAGTDPSWGEAELPKAPTTRAPGDLL
ncbi:MAG TPA: DUF6683 family protein [Ideonella sp.]|nr:DUF6683 family protein [Ideonella sp.]